MKKKLIYTGLISLSMVLYSCDKYFEDYQDSPNDPVETTAPYLLSATELATFASYTGQLARMSNIFTQHLAGTDFQFVDIALYDIKEGDNVNEWNSLYSKGMINAQTIVNQFGDESPYYRGIAKVLLAMNLGVATDLWGDVPYREALNGLGEDGNRELNPSFDAQQQVLSDIQGLLDDAIADFGSASTDNALLPGADDFIFGGDIASWTSAAYMLKARYHNRLSQRDPAGSATAAIAALNAAGSAVEMNAIFGVNGNENNQWFAFTQNRAGYMKMGKYFMDLLEIPNDPLSDPRRPFYATLDEDTAYSGTPNNSFDQSTSDVGSHLATADAPVVMVGSVEMLFIRAEANFRLNNLSEAANNLNDAVKASILQVTGSNDAAFEAAFANEDATTITLDKIMTQKYIAMFGQIEAYNDWRRTGIPALTPNPDGVVAGIPLRLPTSRDERLYNSNAVVEGNVLRPVWWDN